MGRQQGRLIPCQPQDGFSSHMSSSGGAETGSPFSGWSTRSDLTKAPSERVLPPRKKYLLKPLPLKRFHKSISWQHKRMSWIKKKITASIYILTSGEVSLPSLPAPMNPFLTFCCCFSIFAKWKNLSICTFYSVVCCFWMWVTVVWVSVIFARGHNDQGISHLLT